MRGALPRRAAAGRLCPSPRRKPPGVLYWPSCPSRPARACGAMRHVTARGYARRQAAPGRAVLARISHTYEAHRGAESAKVVLRERLRVDSRSAPMPTECSAELFEFAPVERRAVVAGFDGGAITSDAGALLLGATDRAIRLVDRFARVLHRPSQSGAGRASRSRRWSGSGCSGLRWAMRTSTITTNCATIRSWRCWPASCGRRARLRAGGRQVDAQPSRAEPGDGDALSQDRP